MHVMTIKLPEGVSYEIHMLNPGEHFPRFGGSRTGLTVSRKTASLIVRYHGANSVEDTEHDIHDAAVWDAIGRWINRTNGPVEAVIPARVELTPENQRNRDKAGRG